MQSGRALSDWQAAEAEPAIDASRTLRFVIDIDRPALNARIDARFDQMMAEGALDEARAFWAAAPDPLLPAARALGLPQFKRVFDGDIQLSEAVADAKLRTRRYAKRRRPGSATRRRTGGGCRQGMPMGWRRRS